MGKIKKTASTHNDATVSPALREFVGACSTLPLHSLPGLLSTYPRQAQFPRGDLFNWIPALNRFDEILEKFAHTYGLSDGPQTKPFDRRILLDVSQSQEPADEATLDSLNFPPDGDRFLVEKVLDFSKLLFENSANRRLYASSHHLDAILNTTCLSLLNAVLRLTLRLAQKYSYDRIRQVASSREPSFLTGLSQSVLSSHYQIDLTKLQKLALPFRKGLLSQSRRAQHVVETERGHRVTDTYAPDLLLLLEDTSSSRERLEEYGQPYISLFVDADKPDLPDARQRTDAHGPQGSTNQSRPMQTEPSASNSAHVSDLDNSKRSGRYELVEIPAQESFNAASHQVVRDYVVKVPKQHQYEFLCHLRNSCALSGSSEQREQIIQTRLLAIANYLNIFPEDQHLRDIFLTDGTNHHRTGLLAQLCDMLHTSRGHSHSVPKWLQALALTVLEGYTNHATKSTEVTVALGANVNHGILTYIVRKAVNEMSESGDEVSEGDREWYRSLFSLLHSLPKTNPRAGEGFVAAGILESFVDALRLRTKKAQHCFPQILTFLDIFIFNTRDAFNALVNARGLDVLSDLLGYEVDEASSTARQGGGAPAQWKSPNVDYRVSYIQQATLRSLFKLIKNMMAINSGTFDRLLRNLIESSQLLAGLRHVIEQPSVFGSNVWCGAVEIFSNFIHNEPTSYAAIAEAGLTDTFLGTVNRSRTPLTDAATSVSADFPQECPPTTLEAITMIPLAFSAICLNENGMRRFMESKALSVFFADLLKPEYSKALAEAVEDHHRQRRMEVESLGAAFDELARHHPALKPDIIRNVVAIVSTLHEDIVGHQRQARMSRPRTGGNTTPSDDVETVVPLAGLVSETNDVEMHDADDSIMNGQTSERTITSPNLSRMKAISEVLSGFFGNITLCGPFIEEGGIEKLVDIVAAPVYPLDWGIQASQQSFARVVQTFIQQKSHIVLPLLFSRLQQALAICSPFVSQESAEPFFAAYVKPDTEHGPVSGAQAACLSAMLTLRNVLAVLTFSLLEPLPRHSQNPLTTVNLADMIIDVVPTLTALQQSSIWEFTLLQMMAPFNFNDPNALTSTGQGFGNVSEAQVSSDTLHGPNKSDNLATDQPQSQVQVSAKRNLISLANVLRGLPNDISCFLHSIGKSIVPRRLPSDPSQRSKIFGIAGAIAHGLVRLILHVPSTKLQGKASDYYKRSVILNVLQVMVEKSNDFNAQFLTFIIWQFRKLDGIKALVNLSQDLVSTGNLAAPEENQGKPSEATWAVQGLRILFPFLIRATNQRHVSDALQTQALNSRGDRDREKVDHFSTSQFLVEMRYHALKLIQSIWGSEIISKLPKDLMKNVCAIIQHCLEASSEQGAFKRSDKVPVRAPSPVRQHRLRYEDAVTALVEKGFEQSLAQEAFYRCCESSTAAQEYCAVRKRNPRLPRFPIPTSDLSETEVSVSSGSNASSAPTREVTSSGQNAIGDDIAATASQQEPHELVSHLLEPITTSGPVVELSQPPTSSTNQSDVVDPAKVPEAQHPTNKTSLSKLAEEAGFVSIDGLDEIRVEVRGTLVDRCLYALSVFENLSFELADLIISSVAKALDAGAIRADISRTLLHSLISYQGSNDIHEVSAKVASHAHLLGVVFQDRNFFEAAREDLKDNVGYLIQYLAMDTDASSSQSMTWMSNILLVFEKMLFEDLQPQQITWNLQDVEKSSEGGPVVTLKPSLLSKDNKNEIFKTILTLAPRVARDSVLGTSCLRILVSLTRDPSFAQHLAEKRNISRLFVMVKQLATVKDAKVMPLLLLILRHIVEDETIIRNVMRAEIQNAVDKNTGRGGRVTTSTYTRQVFHLSLRAPEIFVDVTNELLTFPRVDVEGRGLSELREQQLILKKDQPSVDEVISCEYTLKSKGLDPASSDNKHLSPHEVVNTDHSQQKADVATSHDETKSVDVKAPHLSRTDGITSFLLSELLAYRDVQDKPPPVPSKDINPLANEGDVEMSNAAPSTEPLAPVNAQNPPPSDGSKKLAFKLEDHPIYVYRILLMQCLTELLQSYNLTKLSFIGYSRRAEPQIPAPVKPHSGVLNYLLQNLIGEYNLSDDSNAPDAKVSTTCNWAMNVLTGLCARVPENSLATGNEPLNEDKDKDHDLSFVRRFVLEHALKAYKDATSSTELSRPAKLSQLHNYADLFNRMLVGKVNGNYHAHQRPHPRDNVQKQIGKIMFEKHFTPILTASISDLETKELESNKGLRCVLRTIKLLTQVAVDLSSTGNLSQQPDAGEADEISSATSASDAAEHREETPDLFRNSTLGMFEPGREDESSSNDSEDDDGDDEVYGDEYADDMEFDEDDPEQADDDVVSEEDDAPENMGPLEGLPGDIPMEVEIELNDEGPDDSDGEDSESDDSPVSSEEDEDDEVEIMEELEDGEGDSAEEDDIDGDEWQDADDDDEIDFSGDSHLDANIDVDDGAAASGSRSISEHDIDVPVPDPISTDDLDDGGESQEFPDEYDSENVHDEAGEQDSDDEEQELEEEDDYLDEELGFDRHDFEEEEAHMSTLPWQWTFGSTRPRRQHGHHHHHQHHHHHHHHHHHPARFHRHMFAPLLQDMDQFWMPELRSQRPSGPRTPEDTQGANPLLNRNRRAQQDQVAERPLLPRMQPGVPALFPASFFTSLGRNLPDESLGVDRATLDRVLQTALGQGGSLQIAMTGTNSRGQPVNDVRNFFHPSLRAAAPPNANREDALNSVAFDPASTAQRWQEGARILFGPDFVGKSMQLINSLLKVMTPTALERERNLKSKREEQERKLAEEAAQRKAEREAREKKEREEIEAREAADRQAAEAEAPRVSSENENEQSASAEGGVVEAMEGVESTKVADQPPEAGPTESAERVVISIRGRDVDITHLGIDPAYLDALPEEMREEVIMQQAAEQRTSATATGAEATTINSEFLDALPPDIREELLQQEAQERRRQEREQARQRAREEGAPAQPEDIDPASLIASLDPMLRQQVLAESDEDMLAALPPEMAAEARALGGSRRRGAVPPTLLGNAGEPPFSIGREGSNREGVPQAGNDSRKPQRRPVVQMLDKAGIAGLLRLMFVQMQSSPATLNAILFNVCGNRQTRSEVINGLLSILQEGCVDVNAAERYLSQLTSRAKQQSTQKAVQKRETSGTLVSDISLPTTIEQCVNALVCLARAIPHVPHFFVTEHDAISTKSKVNRKGKGKDNKIHRYPFMSLVTLLERDVVVKNAKILSELSQLLELITQPLNSIKKKDSSNKEKSISTQTADSHTQMPSTGSTTIPAQSRLMDVESDVQVAEFQGTQSAGESSSAANPDSMVTDDTEQQTKNNTSDNKENGKDASKTRLLSVPEVPAEALKPIINLVMSRECNSKIFQKAIATMTNLSPIQGAREIFRHELIEQARCLAQSIQRGLLNLSSSLKKAENEIEAQSLALAEFSPAGSDQTKFHRILTALDYLFQPEGQEKHDDQEKSDNKVGDSKIKEKGTGKNPDASGKDDFMGLFEEESFMLIWNRLDDVLNAIKRDDNSYFFNVATILLSLIESLMLVCKRVVINEANLSRRQTSQISEPRDMKTVFFSFTNQHRKILNDLVRHNPRLMSNNFSVLIKNPGVLEFDNKRSYFTRRLHGKTADMRHHHHPSLQLHVRRDSVFLDSYKHLHYKSPQEIKYGKFNIRFHNEEGVDAGGVTREWFQVLARQMFNPDYALFNPVASDRTTFHPNNLSEVNPEHLSFFKFIGRIIGKALYENRVLDCHFSRAVYKKILGQPVSIKDMETVDLDYSNNMQWMLTNDITDIITETFSVQVDKFGAEDIIDLVPSGRNIPVTESNKEDYVRRVIEYRLTGSVQEQLDSFLEGFYDIVPHELISIFDEGELELLISGMPDVDVDDWRANTDYHTYNASSLQIQWFWRAVRSFDKEERARLLQFVTGTGKVPLNGFKELEGMNGFTRFSIHKDYGSHDRLPSSHTCFNQLDLPEYDSYEQLRKNLYVAMTTGNEHFGFA